MEMTSWITFRGGGGGQIGVDEYIVQNLAFNWIMNAFFVERNYKF